MCSIPRQAPISPWDLHQQDEDRRQFAQHYNLDQQTHQELCPNSHILLLASDVLATKNPTWQLPLVTVVHKKEKRDLTEIK